MKKINLIMGAALLCISSSAMAQSEKSSLDWMNQFDREVVSLSSEIKSLEVK